MMIDLTVKTLDSQNHAFSVNDDITVKEFKEHIAEAVNITTDLQRLIYCGRVLQDEKRLSEYDVNGKVIHLVQRAPPSSSQRNGNSSQNQGQGQGQNGDWPSGSRIHYRQAQFHGNPMYVGSVSIPADVLDGHDWPSPQLGSSLADSHLTLVRRMLDQANRVIDRLDNPNLTANPSPTDSNTSQPQQAASSSANASAGTQSTSAPESSASDATLPASQQGDNAKQPTAGSSTENATEPGSAANEGLVPRQLAELLEKLLATQDRLRPHIRERILMTADASGSSSSETTTPEQNQRLIDGVTECFHFLSHAQHALSDISIDMQQPAPRTMRCRPMILQPSAILQAGLPIQVEAHISLHGQSDSSNADSEDGSSTANRGVSGQSPPPTSGANENTSSPGPETQQQQQQQQQQRQPSEQNHSGQNVSETSFGGMFNFPGNVEFLMEMAPQPPRRWSFNTAGQGQGTTTANNNNTSTANNNSTSNNNNNGPGSSGGAAGFSWGAAPSPDIIRNLIQAVAGYMTHGGIPTAPSTPTTSANPTIIATSTPTVGSLRNRAMAVSIGEPSPASGQTSQTRTNTDTHPTTSTQTRTTPRTHVFHPHAQALGVGVGVAHSLDFDPFLPCNSHYIRRGQPTQSNTTSSTQTGQSTPAADASTQSQSRATPATGSNSGPRFTTITGVQIVNNSFDSSRSLAETFAEVLRSPRHCSLQRVLMSHGIQLPTNCGRRRDDPSERRRTLIFRLFDHLAQMNINQWYRILNGDTTPVNALMRSCLCDTIRDLYPSTDANDLARQVAQAIVDEVKPYLERTFDGEDAVDEQDRSIDMRNTFETLISARTTELVTALLRDDSPAVFATILKFGEQLTRVLRYSLRGQAGLDRIIARFASHMSQGTHDQFREWILGTVVEWFCRFSRSVPTSSDKSIMLTVDICLKKSATTSVPTSSQSSRSQPSTQAESEPMETDDVSNERSTNDPLSLDDGEEVATTFPGHEQLLPDWVPIIARDGARQRRQLQLGISGDSVTTLSDAYLATMPNKRRKLVEQQKPPLLTNSTPNHSAIPASMERLVRESVGRAGVEEVEGAAAAVAADPTVRLAFGQAIRECLNPRRYQTPDFPDSLRFPNATRFFTDQERQPKQ